MIFSKIKRIKRQKDFEEIKIGEKVIISNESNLEIFVGMTTILNKKYGITVYKSKYGINEKQTNFRDNSSGSGYHSIVNLIESNNPNYQKYNSMLGAQK